MRGKLVCLIGIDGSGKTTLAKRLVEEMQARGVTSHYFWGGFSPTVLLRPVLWLAKRLVYREDRHSQVLEQKGSVLKNKMWSTIYHYGILADYVLQVLTRAGAPLLFGWSVVCDRYVHDTVVNTALVLDYSDDKLLRLLVGMQRLIPRPDLTLLADLPEEIAYMRKNDVLSIAFLSERRRRFHLMADAHDLPVLDASKPLDELVEHVTAQVLQLYKDKE
jgi:thymidylate kinase